MTLQPQAGTPPLSTGPTPVAAQLGSPTSLLDSMMEERKKQEWASWLDQEYIKCKNAREPFERQWYLNIAFVQGKHYVAPVNIPNQGFRLTAPKAPPWRVRIVINKIRTAVRTEASKLCSSKPVPIVVPATGEDEDASAARVGELLLKAEFATPDFEQTFRSFVWWGVVTGNSFMKSFWDSEAIDEEAQPPPIPNPMKAMFPDDPNVPESLPGPVVKGEIKTERINPFHIYVPDLLCETLEKQPYIIHVSTRSPLWVRRTYGINATPDARASNTIMDAAILINKGGQDHLDSVLVKEMWIKPGSHADFPEGGVLTLINNKLVQCVKKWPWPFREFPFYKYEGIPTGGFYQDSVVVDLIPLNKEYNRTKSQMIEIKNMMGKPKIMYQRGSINPRQISSEPGQGIPYQPGFNPPIVLPGVEVPQSMGVELDRLTSDFDDISGQHEITRGNTPSQVTSGTAISFLQEQDDSKLSYQVASIEHCIQKLGSHYLKYVAKFWSDERLVKVVGRDNDFEVKKWKGSDLRGNTDVRVQSGSALPFSKAAKQALLTEMMTNGWLDPTIGMEMMDMGNLDRALNEMLVDKRQAQRENLRMAELDPEGVRELLTPPPNPVTGEMMETLDGKPADGIHSANAGQLVPFQPQPVIQVNSYDNHEAHIQWHNMFRKTQEYELLDDALKQNFELHVQAHQMAMSMPQMGSAGLVANQELAPEGASPTSGMPLEGDPNAAEGDVGNLGEGEQPPPQ